ncbi:hypothetical protein [Micromonospora sp. WMMD975]|uniref:hypothetical protein n=1 Tax=Micromonospora sp. WMMD975 TaxID=3016087 RepID=UPI00249A3436|nr:hypothetical protein [Micromonospora sp. WMMD975]WFE31911.1 hypothetical protein O7613_20230 [Micromonospora sp. WMMD975]
MSTLPTLPDCGEPATVRIELYTTDSLDGCVYTCEAHAAPAVAAFGGAGLAAYPTCLEPGVSRPCGHVYVYPTGTLADDPDHPRWCDRDGCRLRGQHRSRTRRTDPDQPAALGVGLVRALHPTGEPMVSLRGAEAGLLLSIGQARVLRYRLARLLDLAAASRRA